MLSFLKDISIEYFCTTKGWSGQRKEFRHADENKGPLHRDYGTWVGEHTNYTIDKRRSFILWHIKHSVGQISQFFVHLKGRDN